MQATFTFNKNTEKTVVEKAETLLLQLAEFQQGVTQKVLDLEQGNNFLHLCAQMGEREFRRMIKAVFPYTYGDILNLLTVAQLHRRFPQFEEKIMNLGASACKELVKASDELAAKVLATTATTLTDIKKIINREKKGLALSPSSAQREQFNVGAMVEVVKKDPKIRGWLAEVTAAPDEFGRLHVRLLKTMRSRQFFVDDVQLYDKKSDKALDAALSPDDWEAIKAKYNLDESSLASIQELAHTNAQQSCSPEATQVQILWKHALFSLESYRLEPVLSWSAISTSTDIQPNEKTYTWAEVQAQIEAASLTAAAQVQAMKEAEWLERERVLLFTNRQLQEKLDELSRSESTTTLQPLQSELAIAQKELRELAIENGELKTQLLQAKESQRSLGLNHEEEAILILKDKADKDAVVEDLAVEETKTELEVYTDTDDQLFESLFDWEQNLSLTDKDLNVEPWENNGKHFVKSNEWLEAANLESSKEKQHEQAAKK